MLHCVLSPTIRGWEAQRQPCDAVSVWQWWQAHEDAAPARHRWQPGPACRAAAGDTGASVSQGHPHPFHPRGCWATLTTSSCASVSPRATSLGTSSLVVASWKRLSTAIRICPSSSVFWAAAPSSWAQQDSWGQGRAQGCRWSHPTAPRPGGPAAFTPFSTSRRAASRRARSWSTSSLPLVSSPSASSQHCWS